ncbi:MAG: DUF86 domain-containing protein [Candidatus Aenigmarchaeota archaeon]|nr:DUF86 domain-containing protein [Candidatus Aenigmarchaeota archaeon]
MRNIIVHMYADIKADVLYDNLDDIIKTLKEYANQLLEYCKTHNIHP